MFSLYEAWALEAFLLIIGGARNAGKHILIRLAEVTQVRSCRTWAWIPKGHTSSASDACRQSEVFAKRNCSMTSLTSETSSTRCKRSARRDAPARPGVSVEPTPKRTEL